MSENRKFILNIQSIALLIYGVSILPSVAVSFYHREMGLTSSMAMIAFGSIFIGVVGHHALSNVLSNVSLKTCYYTTITTWLIVIILSALPYYAADRGYSFIDCLYTATASWTTCGTTAISLNTMPTGLLLWRSTCNWMGGIGLILLTLSFLPSWQFIGQKLASTEIRGPGFLMSNITFRKAYRRIMIVYFVFTIMQYIALRVCGMSRFQSILTTLSNTSTSGMLHINDGVITALPASIKAVISFFAFLSSVNISIFVLLVYGKIKTVKKNSELRFYLSYIVAITIILTVIISFERGGNIDSGFIGTVLMQTISFASTAGFIVSDCVLWSAPCQTIIIVMMFVGACAISTGGGIKMSRVSMALSCMKTSMFRTLHPNAIRDIKFNGEVATPKETARVNVYILLFMITFFFGSLALTIDGTSVMDALAYSQAMLTNCGTPVTRLADPGLLISLGTLSKLALSFLMLCGRLEIYPVLLLFTRRFLFVNEN